MLFRVLFRSVPKVQISASSPGGRRHGHHRRPALETMPWGGWQGQTSVLKRLLNMTLSAIMENAGAAAADISTFHTDLGEMSYTPPPLLSEWEHVWKCTTGGGWATLAHTHTDTQTTYHNISWWGFSELSLRTESANRECEHGTPFGKELWGTQKGSLAAAASG